MHKRINLTLNLFCATICSFSFSDERFGLFARAGFPVFVRGLFYYVIFDFLFDLLKIFIIYLAYVGFNPLGIKNANLS